MQRSPRMTRSQAASETSSENRRTAAAAETEARTLDSVVEKLRQLREERERERREIFELRQELRLRERGQGEVGGEQRQGQSILNYRLKPDNFDRNGSFFEYIVQFELVARANVWSEEEKAFILAASLRGRARSVLEEIGEGFCYLELKSELELRFGECENFQNYYLQFTNRKLKSGEDFASFGGDLERLARLAYSECDFKVRDKIACAQFIAGLPGGNVKQILQLEGIISLRIAIERAKVVSSISGRDDFLREQRSEQGTRSEVRNFNTVGGTVDFRKKGGGDFIFNSWKVLHGGQEMVQGVRKFAVKRAEGERKERRGECWQCGSKEHFRAECPSFVNKHPK